MNYNGQKKSAALFGLIVALLFILQPLSTIIVQDDSGSEPVVLDDGAGTHETPQSDIQIVAEAEGSSSPTAADEQIELNEETRSARKYLEAFKLNFDPYDPEEGEVVTITVDVKNEGNENQTSTNVNVEFWYDDDNFIDSKVIGEIEPGTTESKSIDWPAMAGDHDITVYVDPDGSSGGPDSITRSISVDEANYSPWLYTPFPDQSVKNGDTIEFIVGLTNRGTSRDSFDIQMSKNYDGPSSGWTITKDRTEINDLDSGEVAYVTVSAEYDEGTPVYHKEAYMTLKAESRGDDKKESVVDLTAYVIHNKPILFVDDDDQQNDVERGHYQVSPDQHGPQTDMFTTYLLDYYFPDMWDKATLPGDSQPAGSMSTQGRSGPPMDNSNGVSQDRDGDSNPIYLENYDLIIWDTGYSETLTTNTQSGTADEGLGGPFDDDGSTATHNWYDQQELMKYLDDGGALWWMNNKGVEWHDRDAGTISNNFISDYFQVEKVIQSVGLGIDIRGVGSDPVGRGLEMRNSAIYGVMGDRAEILIPGDDGAGIFYSGDHYSAVRHEYKEGSDPTFRTIYQAGNIASYGTWDYADKDRMQYFEQATSWLGLPVYMPPEVDVGVAELLSPLGELVEPSGDIPLSVKIMNYGQKDITDLTVDFMVEDKDDNDNVVFTDSVEATVKAGGWKNVETTWSSPLQGRHYRITYETMTTSGDEDDTNDKLVTDVTATASKDVGVFGVDHTRTTSYWNTTRPGDETDIWATVHNYGSEYATFKAELEITSPLGTRVFIDSYTVKDLAPGDDIVVQWSWTPHRPAGVITDWHADSRAWEDAYNVSVEAKYSGDQNTGNDVAYLGSGSTEGLVAMGYDDTSDPRMMDFGQWTGVDLSGHGDVDHPTPIHPAYYHMQSPPATWTAVVDDDPALAGGVDWGYVYPDWSTCSISPELDFSDYTNLEGNWLFGGMSNRGTMAWQMSSNFNGVYDEDNVEDATWTQISATSGGSNAWGWYISSGGFTTVNNFAGEESVYIRLLFTSSVSSRQRMGVFADDIAISGVVDEYNFPDLNMEKLSVIPALDSAGVQRQIDMTIHNSGQVDTSNRDDVYIVLDIKLGDQSVSGYPKELKADDTIGINERYDISHSWTPEDDGDYEITATVNWEDSSGTPQDSDGRNDEQTVMAYAKFTAFYDDCEGSQKFSGGVEDTTGGNTWGLGEPTTGPGFAHSGDSCWATNLDGNYPDYDDGRAYIMTDVDLSTVADPMLSFWQWLEVEANGYDTARVRMRDQDSRAGDWVTIWENPDPEDFGLPYATDGWEFVEIPLSNDEEGYDFGYSEVDIRFEIESDGDTNYAGWYLDDIGIGGSQPPENDAAVDGVLYPVDGGYIYPGIPVTLKILVSNVGTAANNIKVDVDVKEIIGVGDERDVAEFSAESGTVGPGKSTVVDALWQVPYADNTDYRIYFTVSLKGKTDANLENNEYDMILTALMVHDIGVLDLYAKPVIQNLNYPRTITAQLMNWGNVKEDNVKVTLNVRDRTDTYHYTAEEYVDIIAQDTEKVEFRWTAVHYEEYYISVNVTLEGDHDEDYTGSHRNDLEIREIRTVERIFYDNCEGTPVFQNEDEPEFWEDNGDGFEDSFSSAGWHSVDSGHQSEQSYYCGIASQEVYANRMDANLESTEMDLSTITDGKLRFYTKFFVEGRKYDNMHVSFRSENNDWEEVSRYPEYADINSADYSSAVNGWLMREYDIAPRFLEKDFQLKFVFKSDSDVIQMGVFIDDISIFASPTSNHAPHARFSAVWSGNSSYSIDLIRYPTPEVHEIANGDLDFIRLPQLDDQGLQGGVTLIGQKTEIVTLDASYSFDPDILDQADLDYIWDFGDGTPEFTTGDTLVEHEFELTDTLDVDPHSGKKYFNVTLTVRDSGSDPDNHVEEMTDYLWIFAGNTPPNPEYQVFSGDRRLTDVDEDDPEDPGTDPVPNNGYIDVFWGDSLEFVEIATDPEGKLNRESFEFAFYNYDGGRGDFELDKTVFAAKLKLEVGGKLLSKDGQTTNYPGTFLGDPNNPPTSQDDPQIFMVTFSVTDQGGERAIGEKLIKVYPYAKKMYSTEVLGDGNDILKPMVEIQWRGFTSEAAPSEAAIHPENSPVFVKIESIDSPTGIDPYGSLGKYYKISVQGTTLQNGKTGYESLTLYMPYSYAALNDLGNAVNLREEVRLYEYSKAEGRTFVQVEGSEQMVLESINYATGTILFEGYGTSAEEISLIAAPLVSTVADGSARPDLTIHSIDFSRNRVLIGSEVEIRAYINNVGTTHAKDFSVRFLDGDSTIGEVKGISLDAGQREYEVIMLFNATEVGGPSDVVAEHQISVVADADRDIFEGTPDSPEEQNNKQTEVFEVVEYAPYVTPSFSASFLMLVSTASVVALMGIIIDRRRRTRQG